VIQTRGTTVVDERSFVDAVRFDGDARILDGVGLREERIWL